MGSKWYNFDQSKGSRQKRPSERQYVLVMVRKESKPYPISVGYMRNAAGDKQSPYFVTPGLGGEAVAWCDCLPEDFTWRNIDRGIAEVMEEDG